MCVCVCVCVAKSSAFLGLLGERHWRLGKAYRKAAMASRKKLKEKTEQVLNAAEPEAAIAAKLRFNKR